MSFTRVRDLRTQHEYDAPTDLVALTPTNYEVLDAEPVSQPRAPKHHVPEPDGEGITEAPEPVSDELPNEIAAPTTKARSSK